MVAVVVIQASIPQLGDMLGTIPFQHSRGPLRSGPEPFPHEYPTFSQLLTCKIVDYRVSSSSRL